MALPEQLFYTTGDPNLMYDARTRNYDVIRPDDVEAFAHAFVSNAKETHEKTEAALNPAVDRFGDVSEEDKDAVKDALDTFLRLYSFLSQVVTFTDLELEKLYVYGRALQLKLREDRAAKLDISDKVELTHLRTEVTWEGDIEIDPIHEVEQFWGNRPMSEDAQEALTTRHQPSPAWSTPLGITSSMPSRRSPSPRCSSTR